MQPVHSQPQIKILSAIKSRVFFLILLFVSLNLARIGLGGEAKEKQVVTVAEKSYQKCLAIREKRRDKEALPYCRKAVELESDNPEYLTRLGFSDDMIICYHLREGVCILLYYMKKQTG